MPNDSLESNIRHAMALAERALPHDVPVGAFILNPEGEIIAEGWNQREQHHDPTAHAEIVALQAAGQKRGNWRMTDHILVVTLEPCPMCAAALLQARMGTIIFGAYDPIQGALGSALNLAPLYSYDVKITGGILEQECQQQLQHFFTTRRKDITPEC